MDTNGNIAEIERQNTAKIGKKVRLADWTICKLCVKINNCIRGSALFFREDRTMCESTQLGNCEAFTEK